MRLSEEQRGRNVSYVVETTVCLSTQRLPIVISFITVHKIDAEREIGLLLLEESFCQKSRAFKCPLTTDSQSFSLRKEREEVVRQDSEEDEGLV